MNRSPTEAEVERWEVEAELSRERAARDGAPVEAPVRPPSPSEESEVVTTAVSAVVHDSERETVGYIGMAEWDDAPRERALRAATEAAGPAVVLRSSGPSPGETDPSWHLWLPTVRSWPEMIEAVAATEPAEHYMVERVDAREFWLRTMPKRLYPGGEVVAPRPRPVAVVDGSDGPLSRPHLVRLGQLCEESDRDDLAAEVEALAERETVGRTYDRSHYRYSVGGSDG